LGYTSALGDFAAELIFMYSRLSIPLIAGFLLLIGIIVVLCVYKWGGWFVPQVNNQELPHIVKAHSDFLLIEELGGSSADVKPETNSSSSSSSISGVVVPTRQILLLDEQGVWRAYWHIYNERIPRLYSAKNNAHTFLQLGEIASAAEENKIFAGTQDSKWIGYAIAGEREAARAISFDYARSPQTFIEAMAWAMIANAISPNDYFLYLCALGTTNCEEVIFERASIQAEIILTQHGFEYDYTLHRSN